MFTSLHTAELATCRVQASVGRSSLRNRVLVWLSMEAQRRSLASLDDALLRDIGITRAEAEAEARRPFWAASPLCRR